MNISWEAIGPLIGIVALLDGVVLWAVRSMIDRNSDWEARLRELDDRLRELTLYLAEGYMRRDEVAAGFERLKERVDSMEQGLLVPRPAMSIVHRRPGPRHKL